MPLPRYASEYAVTVGTHASEPERFDAAQLAHFLSLGSHRSRPAVAPPSHTPAVTQGTPLFAVGLEAASAAEVNATTLLGAPLREDGFFCQTSDDLRTIVLTGGTCHAVLSAGGGCSLTAAHGRGPPFTQCSRSIFTDGGLRVLCRECHLRATSGCVCRPLQRHTQPELQLTTSESGVSPVGGEWPGNDEANEAARWPLAVGCGKSYEW